MGNICSCLQKDIPKYIISVVGLEEDIKNVLVHIVSGFDKEIKLTKFSEYVITFYDIELIIHAHIITPMIKTLIGLHSSVESAVIYSVDADSKESIGAIREYVEESEVRTKNDIVTVLCRGSYLDNSELDTVKQMFTGNIHDHFEFVKFNNEETDIYVKQTFERIYKILVGRIVN